MNQSDLARLLSQELDAYPVLKVDVEPFEIEIISEPFVKLTALGYAPAVIARIQGVPRPFLLFISPKSLASALEEMRADNGGSFLGLRFSLSKASRERTAVYVVS